MNRFKSRLPQVIRPDIIPTDEGMIITELDSVPGGIGFTANLATQYGQLDYNVTGGSNGMMLGFADMIRFSAKRECPTLAIVVSGRSRRLPLRNGMVRVCPARELPERAHCQTA